MVSLVFIFCISVLISYSAWLGRTGNYGPGDFSYNEIVSQRLSENVGMICLDFQFDKIESAALHVLTDIMHDYALEIAQEIKQNAENGGRS